MDPNKLTQKTQEALHDAQTKAMRYGHTEVDVEHLLLALLEQPEGLVPRLLPGMDVDVDALRAAVEQHLEGRPRVSGPGAEPGEVYVSRTLGQLLDAAQQRGGPPEGRVRLRRARAARDDRDRLADAPPGGCWREHGVTRERFLEVLTAGARQPARHQREPGGRLRGAREVRPRPRRRGAHAASSTR